MARINNDMGVMAGNVNGMTYPFGAMDNAVTGVGASVHRMSGPMKRLNRMTPNQ